MADNDSKTRTSDHLAAVPVSPSVAPRGRETAPGKKVFIKTFGCQMNVYDSERMLEQLAGEGFSTTTTPDAADLIVLNTCHIREKAVEKVYSDLGRLKQIKTDRAKVGAETLIAVTGCVAQAEGREITRRQPAVDMVVGPQSYHRLPDLLARVRDERRAVVDTEFDGESKFSELTAPRRAASASAFLTIQEGCDKFCTFCVVPYTRGFEVSRSVADLVGEARALAAAGARELTLLGQNVNAYHGTDDQGRSASLATLLRELAEVDGIERLRYMTSHPNDMTDDLIAVHRDVRQVMPFLHLPVQSGSDGILKAMNRRHTVASYRDCIARIRSARPELALSSDFIVGFPGETDADHAATLALIREIGFAQAYSFKYSPRPGTPAAELEDQVPEAVKTERLAELQALLDAQQVAFNARQLNQIVDVLVERIGREAGSVVGRTPYLQIVHMEGGADLIGRTVAVKVVETRQSSMTGVIQPT